MKQRYFEEIITGIINGGCCVAVTSLLALFITANIEFIPIGMLLVTVLFVLTKLYFG